jgi:O-antigen ligase
VFLAGWTTFAFGGVYPATLVIPAVLCILLLLAYRPWTSHQDEGTGLMELAFAAVIVAAIFQMVPLPGAILDVLSPHDRAVWTALSLEVPTALPLSIDLAAGTWAVGVAAGTLIVFLAARRVFAKGGVRLVVRGIAAIGVVMTAVALAQDATGRGLMYWRWAPIGEGAPPFGPFVNRNHFATWTILAIPLSIGYQAAHLAAHHHVAAEHVGWRRRVTAMLDGRTIWLSAATLIMLVGLAASLSRSGWLGLAVALLCAVALQRRTRSTHLLVTRTAGIVAILALTIIALRVDPSALAGRFTTAGVSAADRVRIWRETIPIVRDFWLTGTGAGTYETAMLVYQRTGREWRFNQAHNHYLQFAAEGGLLLVVPFLIGLRKYFGLVRDSLRDDLSGMHVVRIGALSGLAGVAAQSLLETGLTTPANASLAAICAAIVIHRPPLRSPSSN